MSENTFCNECGTALPQGAGFCASCGTSTTAAPAAAQVAAPAAPQAAYSQPYASAPQASYSAKSKVTAVWLNVLFGCFGFLYTYQTDKLRFWLLSSISIVLAIFGVGFYVGWIITIVAIVIAANRSRDWYANYPNAS
jgi:hypothetical protein